MIESPLPAPSRKTGTLDASGSLSEARTSKVGPEGDAEAPADEVTLAFAVGPDAQGRVAPLPEAVVLATVLSAVESNRGRLTSLIRGPAETLESAAPVYWPLLVLPAPAPGHVAIFDGTGVWRRSFRTTALPPIDRFRALAGADPSPPEALLRFRELQGLIGEPRNEQSITVEGFLPFEPPLMLDVLSETGLNTAPQTPHAAFLPARHPVEWYESAVVEMGRALQQFESDIEQLAGARTMVRESLESALVRVDGDRLELERQWTDRSTAAQAEMGRELDELHQAVRQQIRIELEQIRRSNAAISKSLTSVSVAHTLSRRGQKRGLETRDHESRAKLATDNERDARRQIKDSQRRLIGLHESERQQMMVLADRMALVEQRAAEAYAANELFRDELVAAGSDLLSTLAGQIESRTTQRNLFASYFLPLPALEGMRILWFPLWVATLRSARGVRFLVFPPMQARSPSDASSIKGFFGGLQLPLEPRSARFDASVQETIQTALATDGWFQATLRDLVHAADVTTDADMLLRLGQGLGQIREAGWISEKQERRILEAFSTLRRTREDLGGDAANDEAPRRVPTEEETHRPGSDSEARESDPPSGSP